jgi:hypothetical protein
VGDAKVHARFGRDAVEPRQSTPDHLASIGVGRYELRAPVDATGAFAFADLPADTAVTVALHLGGAPEPRIRTPEPIHTIRGKVQRVSWNLTATRRFVCSVRETDGTPAREQAVALFGHDEGRVGASDAARTPTRSTSTDAAGVAVFEGIEPGPWLIGLVAPEKRKRKGPAPSSALESAVAAYTIAVEMPTREGDVPVELTLHRGLYIEGHIVAPEGNPQHLMVHAASERFHAMTQIGEIVDGRFRVGPLLPGHYTVGAVALSRPTDPAYAPPTPVEVEAGTADVELVLRPGGSVTLHAINATTREAVNAQFGLSRIGDDSSYIMITGGRKDFEARGREPGAHCALARASDGRVGIVESFNVEAGETSAVTIEITSGGLLVVRAPDDDRMLTVHVLRGEGVVDHQPLEYGAEARSILPAGRYRVGIVSRDPSKVLQSRVDRFDSLHDVEVRVGEETVLTLTP